MRILVTGGSGFIGKHLSKKLLELGHEVYITGLEKANCPKVAEKFTGLNLSEIDAIIHLAAITDTTNYNEKEVEEVNFHQPVQLFNQAIESGIKKLVYASSCAVYGRSSVPFYEDSGFNPMTPYARSKTDLDIKATELSLKYPDVSIIGLRYTNVYGCGEENKDNAASMVYQLFHQAKKGHVKLFKHGEQLRDWVFILDAVKANLLALDYPKSGVFNIGSGVAISFNHLVNIFEFFLKKKIEVEYIDNPYPYQDYTLANLDKSKKELGYDPAWSILSGTKICLKTNFQMI